MNTICLWWVNKDLNLVHRFVSAVISYDSSHIMCRYVNKDADEIKVLFDCPLTQIACFWYSRGGRASEEVLFQLVNGSTYQFNRKGWGSNKKFPPKLLNLAPDDTAFTKWLEFKPSKSIVRLLEFLRQENISEKPSY